MFKDNLMVEGSLLDTGTFTITTNYHDKIEMTTGQGMKAPLLDIFDNKQQTNE